MPKSDVAKLTVRDLLGFETTTVVNPEYPMLMFGIAVAIFLCVIVTLVWYVKDLRAKIEGQKIELDEFSKRYDNEDKDVPKWTLAAAPGSGDAPRAAAENPPIQNGAAIGLFGTHGGTAIHHYPDCQHLARTENRTNPFVLKQCSECRTRLQDKCPNLHVWTPTQAHVISDGMFEETMSSTRWGASTRRGFVA